MSIKFRPKFHFTPRTGYMNDPNGLIYNRKTGEYHLFYQYSKKINVDEYFGSWIEKNWGHAISKDLIRWEEKAVALSYDEIGLIWSGSCAIDRKNTFGVFPPESDPENRLVCCYACANETPIKDYGKICCCLGYSSDGGKNWEKYEGNPVISNANNSFDEAFGDPKIFWLEDESYEAGGIWVMITVLKVRIFTSHNLREWKFESEGVHRGEPFSSECPDIFPVTVEGKRKWVYSGAGKYYIVGEFRRDENGRLYYATESDLMYVNIGNLYATQHFYNLPDDRILQMSWMVDHSSLDFRKEGKVWDGIQSLPIEFSIHGTAGEYAIRFNPAKELLSLRKRRVLSLSGAYVEEVMEELEKVSLTTFDLEAVFDVSQTEEFLLNVRQSKDECTRIFFTKKKSELEVNTYLSGRLIHEHHHMPVKLENNKLYLRILCDTIVLDVFAQNGESYKSMLFFPDEASGGFSLITKGKLKAESFDLYEIES